MYLRGGSSFFMRLIPLTHGKYAKVDDKDYEFLMQWKWYAHNRRGKWYATRSIAINKKRFYVDMHRIVNATPNVYQTDHRNGDTLDNRKVNLRSVTCQQNQQNRKRATTGVSWSKKMKKWRARLRVNGKEKHIGLFDTLEEGMKARLEAEFRYWN